MNTHEIIKVLPVIMAGGSGTRLWPLSRAMYPKQFLALTGPATLFQQTVARVAGIANQNISVAAPCVVCNEEHRFLVVDQLREVQTEVSALLLEPVGRNTAPAVTLAALEGMVCDVDPILVVTPSDQTVSDLDSFTSALQQAVLVAQDGSIVVLGVTPTAPETGFGYIQVEALTQPDGSHKVLRFVEKPDLVTAESYLAIGNHFWNGGMFVLRASTWLKAIDLFRPDIGAATRAAWLAKKQDGMFIRPERLAWEAIPAESVDYAVIEKLGAAAADDSEEKKINISLKMIPLNAGWSDLGAWDAVWQTSHKDVNGNATVGDALFQNTTNTHVHSTSRLVAAVGVNNLVIIETPDAVLVVDRDQSQAVKHIVSQLSKANRTEGGLHRRVHRPWGWYDSVDSGPRFQVKRILVKPGFSLSLQKHHHRAEHWIVVSGTAEVTVGEKVLLLTENQSTYIPLGEVHRLANPGKLALELIEVQSGSYLGEDDIVRLQDNFGRA
jgi:mannose-1-phosphate guanylyltransferase / mannose-6-phosphate isomerase